MEIEMPNLDSSLFRINLPTGQPRVGSILVAEPFLREEYFNHGVISLVEYERGKSSMGLVLNKTTGYTLGDAIEGVDEEVDIFYNRLTQEIAIGLNIKSNEGRE